VKTNRIRSIALAAALGLTVVLTSSVLPVAAAELATSSGPNTHMTAHLPYGPDTSINGFVWREAIPSDHVCVTPDVRSQAAYDNSQAVNRRDPNGPYGSSSCKSGFVWREAFNGDAVCVTPDTRSKTRYDNSQAQYRVAH
jgi:hypothetical protein